MTNQKNRFFTLIFSCCPGAGEMYLGLYKQGISLMVLFFGGAAFSAWTRWEELLLFLPIVWCYSFFHTHNLRLMPAEKFDQIEDKFLFEDRVEFGWNWKITEKHRRLIGWFLLLVAVSVFWKMGLRFLGYYWDMPNLFWYFSDSIPQILMALIVLYAALRLMRTPQEAAEGMAAAVQEAAEENEEE